MVQINVRRRRPKPDKGKKLRQIVVDALLKLAGETLKAKATRALAIGAVGGAAQYAAAPVTDTEAPRPQVEISAPIPARVNSVDIHNVRLESEPK